MAQKVGSEALDQLSTKIRPNKRYKTDRKDLDGGSLQLLYKNSKWHSDRPPRIQKISTGYG